MKRYLITLIILLILCDDCISQAPVEKRPVYYSNILGVKVISIDTVLLLKKAYGQNNIIPASNFRAVVINLRIMKIYKRGTKKVPKMLILELQKSENGCLYNFEKDKEYKLFAYVSKYSSKNIEKKYRKKMLRLDCYNLPESK